MRGCCIVGLQTVWLPLLVCILITSSAVNLVPRLLHSECEMTYMYPPQYQKVNLSRELQLSFPQYSLHLYRETRSKTESKLDSLPLILNGVPAVFIPGNAGSHKQARSSASIALHMHGNDFPNHRHFDFFTVNLNEEFSGVFGGVLHRQTLFVAASIRHILSLYPTNSPSRPSSVLIIAHSMGGVIAKALFALSDFPSSLVHTIIALSSPLSRPVMAFDHILHNFYHTIADVWSSNGGVVKNVTLVSVSGGDSDVQVPLYLTLPQTFPHLTSSPTSHTLSIASTAVPRNWVSADHQAIVWCRRLQLALTRALFLLQTPPTYQLTSDPYYRQRIFHHLLFRGWKIPIEPANHSQNERGISPLYLPVNPKLWTIVTSTPYYHKASNSRRQITALSLPPSLPSTTLLVASNTHTTHWLYVCSLTQPNGMTADCTDLSPLAHILPPREHVVKYVHLNGSVLEVGTHLVVHREKFTPEIQTQEIRRRRRRHHDDEEMDEFVLMEWCEEKTHTLDLPLWGEHSTNLPNPWENGISNVHLPVPSPHCTITKFTIPQLTHMWTAHSAIITSSCAGVKGGLVLPWLPHTPLLQDNGTGSLTIPLSLQVPAPDGANATLLVWCPRNCSFSVNIYPSFLNLAGKLIVIYTPLLLPWVTAVALSSIVKQQLVGEMVILALIWGATSIGFLPYTDWEVLTSNDVWPAWGPLLIHLVAHGLFLILRWLLNVPMFIICHCLHDNLRRVVAGFLMLLWLPASFLCGAAGFLCVLSAYTLMASDESRRHVQSLLVCLSVLTLPSLGSWLKNIKYSIQLSPDPLFWPITIVASLTIIHLLLVRRTKLSLASGGCGFLTVPLPLPLLSPYSLLSLLVLLYSTIHIYRLTYFILAAIIIKMTLDH